MVQQVQTYIYDRGISPGLFYLSPAVFWYNTGMKKAPFIPGGLVSELLPLERFSDALDMRRIRNRVASFMTHNNGQIDPVEQLVWWLKTYIPGTKKGELFGYVQTVPGTFKQPPARVGYGLISLREEHWWVSGGIIDEWRGQGLGEELFRVLTNTIHHHCKADAWLDVLATNERAIALYRKLGYEQAGEEQDGIIEMVAERP